MLSFGGKTKIGKYAFSASYIRFLDLTNVISVDEYAFSSQEIDSVYFTTQVKYESNSFQYIDRIYYQGEDWQTFDFNCTYIIKDNAYEEFLFYVSC